METLNLRSVPRIVHRNLRVVEFPAKIAGKASQLNY